MTYPQATEDGETWPKDTKMDAGEHKNAQLAEEKVTTQETAELNGTMNFGAPGAIETSTATTLAD